jgi:hypothetical protein
VVTSTVLDGNDLTLVMVLVALIAATTGIQLPGVITRVNGGGNAESFSKTITTVQTSAPKQSGATPPNGTDCATGKTPTPISQGREKPL